MAITLHTGYPGAGKSHALVKDVIVPAVLNGRRVLTNVDGIKPDAVYGYCAERAEHGEQLGSVELFDGSEALLAGFWPDESTGGQECRVRGGDLVVFDEWRLYFPNRGKWPAGCNVEKFLRWHRHLTDEKGRATDVAIGSQLATDLHPGVRGLIERSYKYAKLRAVGLENQYSWRVWQGHLQPKGEHFANGTGKYDTEIFPLYSSSGALPGSHVELKTNRRDSIWSQPKTWVAVIAPLVLLIGGGIMLYRVFLASQPETSKLDDPATVIAQNSNLPPASVAPSGSPWRIIGYIQGETGTRVIVTDDKGSVRMLSPSDFSFEDGRPTSGVIDGKTAVAEDALPSSGSPSYISGLVQ